MSDLARLASLSVDPTDFELVKPLENNTGSYVSHSLVQDSDGNQFCKCEFEIANAEEQTKFMRDITNLTYCEHPMIAKLYGYSFFNDEGLPGNLLLFTAYPERGFLTDLVDMKDANFDSTAKSKFIFGVVVIGSFLHSRNIIHRCFAPPAFGVTKNYEPLLMNLSSSKAGSQNVNTTLQFLHNHWLAPEVDDTSIEVKENQNYACDVFSFGTLLYYVFTGIVPFYDRMITKIHKNRENRDLIIPEEMPEDMKDLLRRCWSDDMEQRPHFSEILLNLQSHMCLFPGTKLAEFDKYVNRIISIPVSSPVCSIAPKNLSRSVNTVYASVITNYKMKYDPKILKALYTIKEQVDSYIPIIIKCVRGGIFPALINVPSFMFVAALNEKISDLFGMPEVFQKLEIEEINDGINEGILVDAPYLTMDQVGIKNGTVINVYNAFGNEAIGKNLLKLSIPFIGNVSMAYIPNDTIKIVKSDIHFLTRIPLDKINLKFNKRIMSDKGIGDDEPTLESFKVNAGDTIEVETTFDNKEFEIKVDMSGVIGHKPDDISTVRVSSIMKILDLMKEVKINSEKCFAMYEKRELKQHKAFVDYGISSTVTIEIHTAIA